MLIDLSNLNKSSEKIDFNQDWEFCICEGEFPEDIEDQIPGMDPVVLPHTWNSRDMDLGNYEPLLGSGWYRKQVSFSNLEKGERLLLEMEGVCNRHKVWVNDGYAGGRDGGFLPNVMDITELLVEQGANTILVWVDNAYHLSAGIPPGIDWNRYGGITRPVWLSKKKSVYFSFPGIHVKTPEVSDEIAKTETRTFIEETSVEGREVVVRQKLIDPSGKVIHTLENIVQSLYGKTTALSTELPDLIKPDLWSDKVPNLYTLEIELLESNQVIDSMIERIGYRFFEFDPDKGFILNGKPTQLRGANIHQFFPGLGNALPERFDRSDMDLMKSMGCNYMRTSHYPRSKVSLDACDELGILVMEEQPYWHGSVRACNGESSIDHACRLLKDMVDFHGNHPSIIAWNTVNEVMLAPAYKPGEGHLEPNDPRREAWKINPKEYPYIRRHARRMVETLKSLDPSRSVSLVVGGRWQANDEAGLTALPDIVACNGGAMNLPPKGKEIIGPRDGKVYEFLPDYHRAMNPHRVFLMSEGVLNDEEQVHERGDWVREQTAWRRNAEYWNIMNQRPWFSGGSMWCFTDYTANGLMRLHGVVDQSRLPKDLYYFYAAMWSPKPVIHLLGHWSYGEFESRDVVVFTNCDDVELFLNGRSLGAGESCQDEFPHLSFPPIIWKGIDFESGELKVTGTYDGFSQEDLRRTEGKASKIKLECSMTELIADGRDIAYIDVMSMDEDGNRCYQDTSSIQIEVEGGATLAGDMARDFLGGLLRLAIRSSGDEGDVYVRVSRESGNSEEIKLVAVKGNS